MLRPVLVTPPAVRIVSVADVKLLPGVDADDVLIEGLIDAAIAKLDGWTGVLGRALAEQTWRQDIERFDRCMELKLGPVLSIEKVAWVDLVGDETVIDSSAYRHVIDAGGRDFFRFVDAYGPPSGIDRNSVLSVTYKAGYPTVEGVSTVPAPIKTALLFTVKDMLAATAENGGLRSFEVQDAWREDYSSPQIVSENTRRIVDSLLAPYRRYSL
ncbi:head-tail connector protein [Pararhizobium haloflavum]|uniref:head-tail connector protein n=1 Tax=Pararhizobium haloflavum TaxID=2037914 RepID=UPI00130007BF|nr:hypothetical protein [Pararhizobium haloflavum]